MNTRLCWYVLAAAVQVGLGSQAARAQSFSFSIGHGHHHGHHHHHCWDDHWCGPHWDYYYVAPPPIVRREIRYVQPVERVIETRVETPQTAAATPKPNALASRPASQQPLQIWNSGGERVPVAFIVDGQEVTLSDGQSHTFYGGGARLVEFDRGGDFGIARRSLAGSQYEFVITSGGWDLVSRTGPAATAQRTAPKNELPVRR
jgi:hypothetical protein